MGNIGITEIALILVLIMFLFGPEQLPDFVRKIRTFLRDFEDFKRETRRSVKELESELLDAEKPEEKEGKDQKNEE